MDKESYSSSKSLDRDRPEQSERHPIRKANGTHRGKVWVRCNFVWLASPDAMDEEIVDALEPSITGGEGDTSPLRDWTRSCLDPTVYKALFASTKDPHLQGRDHILARITPRERVFIEHVCRHPEQTDEEVMAALGLKERTVQAYYVHLGRNFNGRNNDQLRRWAFKECLLSLERDEAPSPKAPPEEPPSPGFDPWVRWY